MRPPTLPSLRRNLITAAALLVIAPVAWSQAPAAAGPPIVLRLQRELGAGRSPVGRDGAIFARAEKMTNDGEERVVLEGSAEIRRGGLVLRGDRVIYTRASDELEVQGSARAFGEGIVFTGPSLRYRIDAQTGSMPEARFSYPARNATGSARDIELLGDGRACMREASYTTCDPDDPAWWVKANELEIDQNEELAVARGGSIYFQGVPILASPYLQFPLSERRRSGFLVPSLGQNSQVGWDLKAPYYWDIAPNRDATITPRVMTRRGVMLENEFRYLEPTWRGRVRLDGIANDRVYGSSRGLASLQHEYSNPSGIVGGWNYTRVSDSLYFTDFGTNIVTATANVLPQEAFIGYNSTFWNTSLRVTKNQTLQPDPRNPVQVPYERVPSFALNGARLDLAGFDLELLSNVTRFSSPPQPADVPTQVEGDRLVVNPIVSYPVLAPGYFVVPKAQWYGALYGNLDPAPSPAGSRQTLSVPLLSLDSGLIFERDAMWFGGRPVRQTLEPRLFYAYVPFRDQDALPNFDTAQADINFTQLFRENEYVGGDRVGQANQLTVALSTRMLDPASGAELLRATYGQRFYYAPQNVTLPGQAPQGRQAPDMLLGLAGQATREWSGSAFTHYSQEQGQIVRAAAQVRYQPRPASVLNLGYRFRNTDSDPQSDFNQVDFSAQWPLSNRWYALASTSYSIKSTSWVNVVGGFEYKADCWLVRVAGQRFVTAAGTSTTAWLIQLELFGLGSVRTGSLDLSRIIPGYQTINPALSAPGRYEYYE